MGRPQSLSHVRTGNGSIHSHTLLTPPLLPATSEDMPYKPRDNDSTSLTMKGRHKSRLSNRDRRRLNRACASSSELRISSESGVCDSQQLGRSRSLPSLHLSRSSQMPKTISAIRAAETGHRDPSRRRWTLPSKAQPTQGLAARVLVEKKLATVTTSSPENLSPAMITLRRASTSRPLHRKMSLTFFPPPKFARHKSGLLTTFLQTITRTEDGGQPQTRADAKALEARRASIVSFKAGQPKTPRKASAPTVFTKVAGMSPSLLQPIQSECESLVRRCSTTFISSGSVYEVIWDENISSSGSDTTPSASATATGSRRRSSAVDKLETQLFRAVAQSRRGSVDLQLLDVDRSTPARSGSFSSILSNRLSRSFRHGQSPLPRSRSQKNRRPVISLPEEESTAVEETISGCIEFFPPLRSRSTTVSNQYHATAEGSTSETVPARNEAYQASSIAEPQTSGTGLGDGSRQDLQSNSDKHSWIQKLGSGNGGSSSTKASRRPGQKYKLVPEKDIEETAPLLRPL